MIQTLSACHVCPPGRWYKSTGDHKQTGLPLLEWDTRAGLQQKGAERTPLYDCIPLSKVAGISNVVENFSTAGGFTVPWDGPKAQGRLNAVGRIIFSVAVWAARWRGAGWSEGAAGRRHH